MESALRGREWFAIDRPMVDGIALWANTRLAHEGGFDLGSRPRVSEWIGRCERALGIEAAPQGLRAAG